MKRSHAILGAVACIFALSAEAKILKGQEVVYLGELSDGSAVRIGFEAADRANGSIFTTAMRVGNYNVGGVGRTIGADTINLNTNDDYIPGGNASFNSDVQLTFSADGKTATGSLKECHFAANTGRGGSCEGGENIRTEVFNLRAYKVTVIESPL